MELHIPGFYQNLRIGCLGSVVFLNQMSDYYYIDDENQIIEYYDDGDLFDETLDYEIIDAEFVEEYDEYDFPVDERIPIATALRIDPIIMVALLMAVFVGINLLRDRGSAKAAPVQVQASAVGGAALEPTIVPDDVDWEIFGPIYDQYVLTQGPHGFSYGHMAVDINAGDGAEIFSPIYGEVTGLYIDDIGNTVLEIENPVYKVTLMHGIYTVSLGDSIQLGQIVGSESNQGNTYDMAGRSCRGRDCGYHTHLNVFDKRLGGNVNPLDLLP